MKKEQLIEFLAGWVFVFTAVLAALLIAGMFNSAHAASADFKVKASFGQTVSGKCGLVTAIRDEKTKSKFVATVDLTKCTTGKSMRDGHMAEDLESQKYPIAKLEGVLEEATFRGNLTVHGVTKEVSGMRNGDNGIRFHIKLSDFGVPRRCFLGVCVKDEAEINGEF